MHTRTFSLKPSALVRAVAAVFLSLMVVACALPLQAQALEVTQCTARPNSDSTSEVLGATVTRVTWQAHLEEGEQVSSLTLTLPEGTSFGTENARATLLTGPDLMTRVSPETTVSSEGQAVTFSFAEPVADGDLRVEIYDVKFPTEGGQMQVSGTFATADGSMQDVSGIPSITVTGISPVENLSKELKEMEWVQAWNSNAFLHLFFDPTIIVTSFPVVFNGFLMALAIVAVAFPLAIPIGLVLALMRMAKLGILRFIASAYVNIVRGTPLFLQIYVAFFGLPLAGVHIDPFPMGVIVLCMNSGAYLCEIFRGGIQSISKGQFEAARSLGMNGAQTMFYVIIPQTVRRVIPTMTSEFILLYKDTSLLAAVGVMEVVMYAKTIVASTGSITPYIVAACFYLVITLPLAKVVGILEAHLAGNDSGKKKKRKKKAGKNALSSATAEEA